MSNYTLIRVFIVSKVVVLVGNVISLFISCLPPLHDLEHPEIGDLLHQKRWLTVYTPEA